MHSLGKKVYLLKRYYHTDSFCSFFFKNVHYSTNIMKVNE